MLFPSVTPVVNVPPDNCALPPRLTYKALDVSPWNVPPVIYTLLDSTNTPTLLPQNEPPLIYAVSPPA